MSFTRRNFLIATALLPLARLDLALANEAKETDFAFSRQDLSFSESNKVRFGGFFGTRYQQSLNRLSQEPIDKVDFVLDDVNFNQKRRFYNYSGDISGRYIEVASLTSTPTKPTTKILPEIIDQIVQYQKEDGHYGREVDWTKPIDVAGSTDQSLEMPILWGNGRLMLGLLAAYERFGNEKALESAKKMADFYVDIVYKRFCDPARMDEYKQNAKGYAAAYVTCVFHGIEGLVRAFRLTGEQKYLECAKKMADFHEEFDTLPVGHSHGSISAHEALVMLYEETNDRKYLDRVVKRWSDACEGGFVFPAGGVCENFIVEGHSDEGCSEADWLRINLMLWRNTGETKYIDAAERTLYNEYQMNQWHTGGFGHRYLIPDKNGCFAWGKRYAESYWCCSYHGPLGYYELKEFLAVGAVDPKNNTKRIYYNFPLDFETPISFSDEEWILSSVQEKSTENTPIVSKITLSGSANAEIQVAVRIPEWCDSIDVVSSNGENITTSQVNAYLLFNALAGQSYKLAYKARPYAEDRRFHKLDLSQIESGTQCVLRYGPHVLATKDDCGESLPNISLKLNDNGSFSIPETLTNAYEMTNEERDGAHSFVFNVTVEK